MDFHSARIWAKEIIESAVAEGSAVADATMGNGNDTQWLCQLVGETGRVYAFDIQQEAVDRTGERLVGAGLEKRAVLFCTDHQRMGELVPEKLDAVVFNLGWLPGAEHGVTTKRESTLAAVDAALGLLKPGGVMTICVYPGHQEGARERETLLKWAAALEPRQYDAMLKAYMNQPNDPPCMIAVQKKLRKKGQA